VLLRNTDVVCRFSLVEANKVDYNALAFRDNNKKFRTNCIGVIAVLENLRTGKNVCVATSRIPFFLKKIVQFLLEDKGRGVAAAFLTNGRLLRKIVQYKKLQGEGRGEE
jgi:hypothetical protein